MKTFLDTNLMQTKTFIVYGNLKDIIWCPDLMPRDLEHYLVKLLKSRGYEHIIFYGEAGTKGAYCLDEKSARFFFSANADIPMPKILEQGFEKFLAPLTEEHTLTEESAESANDEDALTGSQVSDALDALFESDEEYIPGDLTFAEEEQEDVSAIASDTTSERNAYRIRYAYRGQVMSEFLQKIHPLMLKKDSHMAVIFYNMLTTDIRSSDLRDDILDIWEKNGKGNICLMLVPETVYNTSALETRIRQYGLESKFMQSVGHANQSIPNPINCIKIGQPNTDEFKNMLRYLSFVGTEKGHKIRFQYRDLEKLSQRIQYASGKKRSQNSACTKLNMEYMTETYARLSDYIDARATFGKTFEITIQDIDTAWDVISEEGKALQELNRPGWEPAYEKVTEVLKINGKAKERNEKLLKQKDNGNIKTADWGIKRIETFPENENEVRPSIPNFVLLGNPGTGKTTIARLIGRILQEAGILKIGKTVEVKKENLTSSYIAGVPKATMEQVDNAEEGVLFIDEAHLLGRKDGGAGHDGTGVEVVSTLNAAMTSPNHHFSVILAGYEDEMQAVFELDPGFRSRFGNNFIYLKDYSPELLTSILIKELERKGYQMDAELIKQKRIDDTSYIPIHCMINRLYSERDRKRFGNARDIMTLALGAEGKCEHNCIRKEHFYGGLDGKINPTWFVPMDIGASADSILSEMDKKFVGMQDAKKVMRDIGMELEECRARGISPEHIQLKPIILTGNPGVGKTTLANLLPRLYFHYQLLGISQPIIVHASELADRYAGGAQEKVLEYIHKAQDCKGFLFVDEAHELLNEHFDGKGAFKAFMAPTTDREHPFLACFAVYPSKLDEFLNLDPGAERRFQIIHLEDYTGEELFAIMQKMIQEKGYRTTEETDRVLQAVFQNIYSTRTEKTGNAGKVQNVLSDMDKLRRQRCVEQKIPFASPESYIFLPEDIPEELRKNISLEKDSNGISKYQKLKIAIQEDTISAKKLKKVLEDKVDACIYQEKFPKRKKVIEPGHYFFKGKPGTGKTTGVSFLAKYLYELGIVKSPEPIFISASNLVGQYLGETGVKTRERLENSVGRVLMIDEAYALASEDGHANSYKKDAVNEIVNFLDNKVYRKITCVVFAGYQNDMESLYQMNEGLKGRVSEIIFEDFTTEQSWGVLKSVLKEYGISISENAEELCLEQIEWMQSLNEFANGRTIRRYADLLCECLEKRCIACAEEYEENDSRAYEIQREDIPDREIILEKLNIRC